MKNIKKKYHLLGFPFFVIIAMLISFHSNAQIQVIKVQSQDADWPIYGFRNYQTGDTLITPRYDYAKPHFQKLGLAIVGMNELYGVVDSKGKEIIPVKYTRVFLQKGYVQVKEDGDYYGDNGKKDGKFGLYNAQGKLLIAPKYDYLGKVKSGLLRANKGGVDHLSDDGVFSGEDVEITGGKWGFIDTTGKTIVSFNYTYARDFKEDIAKVYVGGKNDDWVYDGKWNYVNKNNKLIIPESFTGQSSFTNGLMIVSKEEIIKYPGENDETTTLYGLINTKGDFKLKPIYYSIDFVNKKLIQVKKNYSEPIQLLRLDLSKVIEGEIQEILGSSYSKSDTLLFVRSNGLWGIVSTDGNTIVPPTFDQIKCDLSTGKNLYYVHKIIEDNNANISKNLMGIIDIHGKEILPIQYEDFQTLSNSYSDYSFLVKKNKKWGRVDQDNQLISPFEYETLLPTDIKVNGDMVFLVSKKGKWGLIDNDNNVIIDLIFDTLPNAYDIQYGFRKNSIKASYGGKIAIIDQAGKFRYPPKFENIDYSLSDWKRNRVEVSENGKVGLTDTLGNIKVPLIYDELIYGEDRYILGKRISKYFLIDTESGEELMEFEDVIMSSMPNGSHRVVPLKKNGKWGYVNVSTGTIFSDFQFEEILNDNFYCGVNRIKINGKYGLLGKNGKIIIPAEYDEMIRQACSIDRDDKASMKIEARKGRKWGLLNFDGTILKEFKYKKRVH